MRPKITTGIVLSTTTVLVVLIGAWLGLELESVALLGVTVGAVAALVPDRSPLVRLGGFAAGLAVAWIGYVVRAAALPDTSGGRAVALGLVVLSCAALAIPKKSVPLWSLLLGVAAVAGAYETTFAATPTEVLSTSLTMVTSLLLTVAFGFFAVATFAPATTSRTQPLNDQPSDRRHDDLDSRATSLDHTMEPIK